MNHKKITQVILSLLAIFAFAVSCSESGETADSSSSCPTKTCGDFTSQAQAQATYDSNKSCYKNLDSDGDGKACESLK